MEEHDNSVREELSKIVGIVSNLTGLPTRWNGILELVPNAEFRGRKPFSCTIQLDEALAYQTDRWPTLIHEALHSVSTGYLPSDFRDFRGWEEGVVEQLQRLLRPTILNTLDIRVDEQVFLQHEAHHRFNEYIAVLEDLRLVLSKETIISDATAFYTNLLRTPIKDRPAYVLDLGYQREGLPRMPFVRAFSAANAVLTRKVL